MTKTAQTHTSSWNQDISIWLSVDPLSDKYPGWSPYNYCLNNPLKYIDPKGETPLALIGEITGAAKSIVTQTISNGVDNLENGNGFFNNWSNKIDCFDVAVTAGEGALACSSLGLSLIGDAVLRSAIDYKLEEGLKVTGAELLGFEENNKSLKGTLVDLAGESLSFGIGKGLGIDKLNYGAKNIKNGLIEGVLEGSITGIWDYGINVVKDLIKNKQPDDKPKDTDLKPSIHFGKVVPIMYEEVD